MCARYRLTTQQILLWSEDVKGCQNCQIVPDMTYNVFCGTLSLTQSINQSILDTRCKLKCYVAKIESIAKMRDYL